MNWQEASVIVAGITAVVAVVGWFVGYKLGLRSKRLEREWQVQDAKLTQRGKFIEFANLIKTTINVTQNPADWVNFFKDNAVEFLTCYDKTEAVLIGEEKVRIDNAMKIIRNFASMNHGDIYEKEQELFTALNAIPES